MYNKGMEDKKTTKAGNQAKILSSKFQNMMQLVEQKDENGKQLFIVQVVVGKTIFWVKFDDFEAAMWEFQEIVNFKQVKK